MKKIFIQVPNEQWANNNFFKDELHLLAEPWRELKRQLFSLGYELLTADDNPLDDCEWIFFIDSSSVESKNYKAGIKWRLKKALGMSVSKHWPFRNLYKEGIEHGLQDRMMFFLWEPNVVDPYNFDRNLWKKFKYIFTSDPALAKKENFHLFLTPLFGIPPLEKTPSFSQKKLLVNISTNKFSSHPNESYGKRRETLSYFTKYYPDDFDLYGTRWNSPQTRMQRLFPWILVKKYSTYKGSVPRPMMNKLKILSKYKFTLCYENMLDGTDFFTEKIFDALCARTVPIYWGAPHISEYVDEKAYIDRCTFANDEDLAQFISKMPEKKYTEYLIAGEKYLQSEKYKQFLPKKFAENIIKNLGITKREI